MARAPLSLSESKQDAPTLLAAVEKVTYTPSPGDPNEVTWMRHKFKAHVPHDVRDAALIEKARGNKFFHVGEFDASQHAYKDIVAEPKTAEAYRAWAIGWMKKLPLRPVDQKPAAVEVACEQWANEARMRAKLEVGFDDYKYISDFFAPLLSELIKREDEPRQARDKIVRNGEFADLFLQISGVGQAAA